MQSPFIRDCTNETNFQSFKEIHHKTIEILKRCMHVDDIVTVGDSLENVITLKGISIQLIKTWGFSLHTQNWNFE